MRQGIYLIWNPGKIFIFFFKKTSYIFFAIYFKTIYVFTLLFYRIAKLYDKKDVTDAFVDVILGNARVAKTKIIDNDLNPEWNEFYRVEVCHQATYLTFDVRDKDHAYTEKIGLVNIECDKLKTGN